MVERSGTTTYSFERRVAAGRAPLQRHWPNPVTDQLYVEPGGSVSGSYTYTLLNTVGGIIHSATVLPCSFTALAIPTARLFPDVYYLRVQNNKGYTFPLIRFAK